MFKFGFSNDSEAAEEPEETTVWMESQEVYPHNSTCAADLKINSISCADCHIKYVSDKDILNSLKNDSQNGQNSLLSAEQNHSDLITAVYEGGLKIWECTFDLLSFISKESINFQGAKVLDLGCGAGIVGIFAALKGAKTVFQDYNLEVINNSTIPNTSINNISCDNCRFYSGDWQSFLDLWKKSGSEKFDFIFTSETIYNINNYKKILNIFRELLVKNGIIYLAAKSHYFGVGGGVGSFEDSLEKEDIFNYSTTCVCSDGVKRAIIKITLK